MELDYILEIKWPDLERFHVESENVDLLESEI